MVQEPPREGDPGLVGVVAHLAGKHAKQRLHGIDAGATQGAVDHEADAAVGGEQAGEGLQAGRRVGQVVQHAAAIDVVERTEPGAGQVLDGQGPKFDVGEPPGLGPGFGDGARGPREVGVMHRAAVPGVGQLLGQHDGAVAGAAARHQGAEGAVEIAPAGEDEVVDLEDVAGRTGDQSPGLVGRVALGIGEGLVLGAHRIAVTGHGAPAPVASAILPVDWRPARASSAAAASSSGRVRETRGFKAPAAHQA